MTTFTRVKADTFPPHCCCFCFNPPLPQRLPQMGQFPYPAPSSPPSRLTFTFSVFNNCEIADIFTVLGDYSYGY